MSGDEPELLGVDDRSGNFFIALSGLQITGEGQQCLVELGSAGQPVGHAGGCLIEHEQIQGSADLFVVSLLGFLHPGEMGLELGLIREGVDIDALERIALLVAAPVGTGDRLDFESGGEQFSGIAHVRSAAQVDIVIARIVQGEQFVFRQILNQFGLELLILEQFKRFGTADFHAAPVFLALEDFLHLGFDFREIFGCHRARQNEVIVQTVCDLRADGILHVLFAEHLNDGLGQNMGQGMTVHLQEFFSFHSESILLMIVFQVFRERHKKKHFPCRDECLNIRGSTLLA